MPKKIVKMPTKKIDQLAKMRKHLYTYFYNFSADAYMQQFYIENG